MSQKHFSAHTEVMSFDFNTLQVKACAENMAADS
jgi:hypothetical protein